MLQRLGRKLATALLSCSLLLSAAALAENSNIAAAASLRYALTDILALFAKNYPQHSLQVTYGSSGKLSHQIINGAPFDLFISADMQRPEQLEAANMTAASTQAFAIGRMVIWQTDEHAAALTFADLTRPDIRKLAIAQPAHAPYGKMAQQALEAAGIWQQVQSKLVFGENIAQTAQMTQSGAAEAGIIALSLAKNPNINRDNYFLIDASMHQPLVHGLVLTKAGANNSAAIEFARFMQTDAVTAILKRYGFERP